MKKIAAITTVIAISVTMLSTIPASAKKIKISRAKITRLQSSKPGRLTIKIKKMKKCSGYKVKISQNKKFSKAKTYKMKKNKKTISGLKQGKKYFVKARAYKKIKVKGKSKTIYGKWSKMKSIKIKVKNDKNSGENTVKTKVDDNKNDEKTPVNISDDKNNDETPVYFDSEEDKERREQIEKDSGIKLSNCVKFLNYSYVPHVYEEYGNIVDYYTFAKVEIKETELNDIIKDNGFHKSDNDFIPPGIEHLNDYCDWWDLKITQIKDYYSRLYTKHLSENFVIRSAMREIVVTNERSKNGYLTVYITF